MLNLNSKLRPVIIPLIALIVGLGAGTVVKAPPEVITVIEVDTLIFTNSAFRDHVVATEARRAGVPIPLAIAVSHAENWSGKPDAVSPAGAVGIMQVMPDKWGDDWKEDCYGDRDLTDFWRNACLGVRILQFYHDSTDGNWNLALRAYNGSTRYESAGNRYVTSVVSRLAFDDSRFTTEGSDQ